jgi:hypothetical protein
MTDNHDSLPAPGEDPVLDEALSQLKRLQPPLESRIANRMAVASALDELNAMKQRRQLPWWRRTIAVPVPVAACLLVLTTLAVAANFRGESGQSPMHTNAPENPAMSDPGARDKQSALARRSPTARAELKFYETETYLCGIGRISSESHYFIEE